MLGSMPRHCAALPQRPATGVFAMTGVVAGAALQLQQPVLWPLWVYAALTVGLGLLALVRWWCPGRSRPWLVFVLALGMVAASTGWRASWFQTTAMPAQWEGRDVQVQGVISDMPQPMERGVRLRFDVEQAWTPQGQPLALPPVISLTWYGERPVSGLHAGQRWRWTVRLKAPHGERNPHSTDWELWWWAQGIQATGYVRAGDGADAAAYLGQTWQAPLAQWRGRLHAAIQAPAAASAREQASWGVVQALVTGAQSSMTRQDWQLFRDTGVAHLVSISGLHITMFAWLAMAVVNVLWRRSMRLCVWVPAPLAAAWVGLGLATVYALLSGWGIPAQRTTGMLGVVVLLRSLGHRWPWPHVWLTVLAAVVLLDPWSLLQPGFWLSFVAVGVLFAAQPFAHQPSVRRWHTAAYRLVREQLVVGLALAPLTLLLFGQISVVGMLANLWAIPWVTMLVTPLSMLGVVCPPLWGMAAHAVTAMVAVLEYMASWPLAVLYFAQPAWWAACAGVAGCLWLVMPLHWRWRLLGVPAVCPMLLWQPAVPQWGHFELLALDVGQGSAVLLRTQQHSLLFDAGPRWSEHTDAGARTVVPVLRALGVDLNAQMISHADSDHAGGAASVQQAFPAAQWWGAGGVPCQQGQSWTWDGVQLQVLHPAPPRGVATASTSNASSCVLQVRSHAGPRALLTGDIEVRQEQALLRAGVDVRADVMLVPHHGSTTSSSAAFIRAVQPALAIVQSGYRNRFGHPAASVMARYRAAGVAWVSSPDCGAACWRSWQPEMVQCERALHQRYWR